MINENLAEDLKEWVKTHDDNLFATKCYEPLINLATWICNKIDSRALLDDKDGYIIDAVAHVANNLHQYKEGRGTTIISYCQILMRRYLQHISMAKCHAIRDYRKTLSIEDLLVSEKDNDSKWEDLIKDQHDDQQDKSLDYWCDRLCKINANRLTKTERKIHEKLMDVASGKIKIHAKQGKVKSQFLDLLENKYSFYNYEVKIRAQEKRKKSIV